MAGCTSRTPSNRAIGARGAVRQMYFSPRRSPMALAAIITGGIRRPEGFRRYATLTPALSQREREFRLSRMPIVPAERMSHIGQETAFEVLVRARALEARGRSVVHLEI